MEALLDVDSGGYADRDLGVNHELLYSIWQVLIVMGRMSPGPMVQPKWRETDGERLTC